MSERDTVPPPASGDRICPACGRYYDGDRDCCPSDGRSLLPVGARDNPRIGQLIDDRFTLIGVLGTGGMGVVYRALQHSMCREVALKLLDKQHYDEPDAVARFLREAREVSRLNHPNVITLFDFGRTGEGELYLVMELLEGRALSAVLEGGDPLDLERASSVVLQMCDALQAAHDKHIVHRDLKPENVFIIEHAGRAGVFVKVIDFGIAKTQALEGVASITQSQLICGTPLYMSPEQVRSEEVDGRSDLYAVGCLFYEMMAGAPPFVRKNMIDTLVAHMREDPPPIRSVRPDAPGAIERLIQRTLAKDPADRPQTAAELKAELEAALEERRTSIPPPPRPGHDARSTNLSPQMTSFVGRGRDVEALHDLFAEGRRLVTIHGPGGVGKTRLAQQYAKDHLDDYAADGGAWFCDLTEADTLDGVCLDVARVLHVPLLGGQDEDPVLRVAPAIAARGRVLLVVDNFEQVAEHGANTIGRWLALAPEARFLVTSRERLALPEEGVYALEPLSVPPEGEELAESEAVKLFVDRARAVRPGFEPGGEDAEALGKVVRRLDGMPLAIELAAARMSILSPRQLLARLEERFELLSRGFRGASSRQATLRGAIDWSWSLLPPHEQAALAQLSTFAGGFTAEAAEGVLDLSGFDDAPWALDAVQSLGDKSLVRTTVSPEFPGELRLGLYESIREYAAEKLAELGGTEAAEARHAAYFLDSCGSWAESAMGRDGVRLRKLLSLESENLVAILRRSLARAGEGGIHGDNALRAVLALDPVLRTRGPFGPHLEWMTAAVDAAEEAGAAPALLARGYCSRGEVRRTRKRSDESGEDFERALAMARDLGDARLEGQALFGLGNLSHGRAHVSVAVDYFEKALAVQRAAGDRAGMGTTLAGLSAICIWLQRLDEAQQHLEEGLACIREDGDRRFEGFVLICLGALHHERRQLVEARVYAEQGLGVLKEASELRFQGEALMYLAWIDWELGELGQAMTHIDQALAISREVGDLIYEARYQAILSAIQACGGLLAVAADGFDRAEARAQEAGSPLVEVTVSLLRGQLDLALARGARAVGDDENATRHGERARARMVVAEAKGPPDDDDPDGSPSMADQCDEVRFVLRMLKQGLGELDD